MYVPVKDLPIVVQQALSSVGYGKKDIEVIAAETATFACAGSDGQRAFVIMCSKSEYKTLLGSWGGSNIFNPQNIVDNDWSPAAVPLDGIIIKGSSGNHVFAQIIVHPHNPLLNNKVLPGEVLSDREKSILGVFKGIKSAYRKEYLSRMKVQESEIDKLISGGYLKKDGRGISVTTEGKNHAKPAW
ncbi:MAG: hypothetical protein LC122_13665 [Chitinophagales bacterium]|nr:hypothetical protein [Chitinophagales bacterium]